MGRIEELVGAHESVPYQRHPEHGMTSEHGIYATWENFKMFTTAHGIPHIYHARGMGKRFFWIFVTFACVAGLTYNTYSITYRFFSYQVSTSQTMNFQNSLIFPAVTVCNNNPVRKSKVLNDPTLNYLIYGESDSPSSNYSSDSYYTMSTVKTIKEAAIATTIGVTKSSSNSTTNTDASTSPPDIISTTTAPQGPPLTSTTTTTSLIQPMGPAKAPATTNNGSPSPNNSGSISTSNQNSTNINTTSNIAPNSSNSGPNTGQTQCGSSSSSSSSNSFGMNWPAGQPPGFATNGYSPNGYPQRADFQLKLQVQQELAQMTNAEKEVLGHQISDLIVDCEYAGSTCSPTTDFIQFYDAIYGNCFMFNSGWNLSVTKQISTKPGPRYGLSLTFNVDQDEYIGEIAESAGMRVVVHDPYRMPFPEDEGVAIAPGLLTYVGTRMTKIARLGDQYSNCTDPTNHNVTRNVYESLHPVGYSQTACYNTCYQRNVICNITYSTTYNG